MKPQHLRLRALRRQLEIEEARLRGRALGKTALVVAVVASATFLVCHPVRADATAPFVAGGVPSVGTPMPDRPASGDDGPGAAKGPVHDPQAASGAGREAPRGR